MNASSNGFDKLNFDGCSFGIPGQLKIGGMLMDHNGTLLRAFFKHIEVDLVNKAEILALLEDLKLVKAKGLSNPSRKGESCSSPIFGKIRREAHGILMKGCTKNLILF